LKKLSQIPWPVRAGVGLSIFLFLFILMVEPASRYYWLLSDQTIPELGNPKSVAALRNGMTNREWTERFVPGDLKPHHPEGTSRFLIPRLTLGWKWFYLFGLFCGAIPVFALSLFALILARFFARNVVSPPLSLIVALVLMAAFYTLDSATRFSLPQNPAGLAELPIQAGKLIRQVWAGPIALLSTALLTSFLPFRGIGSKQGQFVQFFALLRDVAFLGLALLLILFIIFSYNVQSTERIGETIAFNFHQFSWI
jgi:hypothetical protein